MQYVKLLQKVDPPRYPPKEHKKSKNMKEKRFEAKAKSFMNINQDTSQITKNTSSTNEIRTEDEYITQNFTQHTEYIRKSIPGPRFMGIKSSVV